MQEKIFDKPTIWWQRTLTSVTLIAITSLIAIVSLSACHPKTFTPKEGDLLFCISGDTPMSEAISEATSTTDSLSYDHVAMVCFDNGKPFVIEACPKDGVRRISLEKFLAERLSVKNKATESRSFCGGKKGLWTKERRRLGGENGNSAGGKGAGVVVMRVNCDFSVKEAVHRAESMLGLPYDWSYLPDNNKLYCSELIYESYLNPAGDNIFQSRPMNFLSPDGTFPQFWTELFSTLGEEIPQGTPGTNPNDLAHESCLVEVYRY